MSNILCQVLCSCRHVLKGNWPPFTYFKLLQIAFSLNRSAFERNASAAILDDKGFCHSIRLKGLECPLYRLSVSEGDFACLINVTQNVSKFVSFFFFFFSVLLTFCLLAVPFVERTLQKNRRSSSNASEIYGKRCDLIKIEYLSLYCIHEEVLLTDHIRFSFTKSACLSASVHGGRRQRLLLWKYSKKQFHLFIYFARYFFVCTNQRFRSVCMCISFSIVFIRKENDNEKSAAS